jgi:hypothetical protein
MSPRSHASHFASSNDATGSDIANITTSTRLCSRARALFHVPRRLSALRAAVASPTLSVSSTYFPAYISVLFFLVCLFTYVSS